MINNNFGSLFKGNLGRIYRNKQFVYYNKKPRIFKAYIEIDNNLAKNLNLSYFKTIAIHKKRNSYLNNLNDSYFLINENQTFDIKNYLSGNYANEKYNLLDKSNNFLGRSLKISESSSKNQIENYTIRNAIDYFFGVDMYIDNELGFTINSLQEIFFELPFSVSNSITDQNENYNTILMIYAFDKDNNIIDIKKIDNFIPKNIQNWSQDSISELLNFDTIDFENLLNISFDNTAYNNLIRKMNISKTSLYNTLLNRGTNPIESITVQENNNDIEDQNDNISLSLNNTITEVFFNQNLNNIKVGDEIKYKIYLKISGSSKYYILNQSYRIINDINFNLISIRNNINESLNLSKVFYIHSKNVIEINIKLDKNLINDIKFNPTFVGIFFNNINNINLIDKVFLNIPENSSSKSISFNGELLKNILNNSTNNNDPQYIGLTFYLKTNSEYIKDLFFVFEQNFEKYIKSFSVVDMFDEVKLKQEIKLKNENKNTKIYSNLNINYKLQITNYKNTNSNLNKLLFLNYEQFYTSLLTENAADFKKKFDNNIFVIIKKTIRQTINNTNKQRYYIFNKDIIQNINLVSQYTEDIFLNLNFDDDQTLNDFFNIKDNISEAGETNYEISAKIMIIPLDFFSTNVNSFQMKEKIKEIIFLNNSNKSIPNKDELNYIYGLLDKINSNTFNVLNQYDLNKLFNDYCISDSFASNNITLPKIIENSIFKQNMIFEYNYFNFNLDDFNLTNTKNRSKILFDLSLSSNKNISSNTELLNYFENIISDIFESFYYKDKERYIDIFTLKNIGFQKVDIINNINRSFSKKYNISNNIIKTDLTLILSDIVTNFFRNLISISTNEAKNKNFLQNNFYIKLNFIDFSNQKMNINIKNGKDIFIKFPLY